MKLTKSKLKEIIREELQKLNEDAHTAISRGCLSEAQIIEEEENETD